MDFTAGLNPQQQEAVRHVDGPLLILAGAGSGKTRVITNRIAHLISAHQVAPWSILAVTFTNKAAREMQERVAKLLAETGAVGKPEVSTFHSFCVRLLRRDGGRLADIRPGFTRSFNIYDDEDQVALIKAIYRNLGIDDKQFMQHRAALSRISGAKSSKQRPEDMQRDARDPVMKKLGVVYEQYEGRLRQANALDFDDLLLEAVRLLGHDEELRRRYNERYRYLMIDEYQDTNRSQYELMRLLTEAHSNICVVGDEDQSIYSWRGADIRNILDFERDFRNSTVVRLEQNYRSTKNIVQAAGAVVARNKERKGKSLWSAGPQGEMIGLYEALDGENEALYIADTIEKLLGHNPDQHIAILYRTNFQSRQIEEALRRYRRKYVVVGGFSFYQRAEIKDTLAYLKVLLNPNDAINLSRIINVPARGIGRSTVEQLERLAAERHIGIWDALDVLVHDPAVATRAQTALAAFQRLIQELREDVGRRPLHDIIGSVIDRTGYRTMLAQDKSADSEGRIQNLEELMNAAAEGAERGEDLQAFLDHAALVSDADQVDERAPVSLLTIHNAKGLEFPVVFLAGLEEGLFPHSRSLDSEAAMEEERRLCYVGMTRAEKRLILSWAKMRRKFGGSPPERTIRSRFVQEVPPNFIQNLNKSSLGIGRDVDLFAEQHEVRSTVDRTLWTGKTYNSKENIAQFFAQRGMPVPKGISNPEPSVAQQAQSAKVQPGPLQSSAPVGAPPAGTVKAAPGAGVSPGSAQQRLLPQTVPAPVAASPRAAGKPVVTRKLGPGSVINHPKYGLGTILRKEGEGEDAKLTINFSRHGLKKLVAKYAGLSSED